MIHRKSIRSKIWHCCRNCRFWPERKGEYTERNSKPVQGELCDFCQTLIREDDCTSLVRIGLSRELR
jgi:methionyl-tRNA synthetase